MTGTCGKNHAILCKMSCGICIEFGRDQQYEPFIHSLNQQSCDLVYFDIINLVPGI